MHYMTVDGAVRRLWSGDTNAYESHLLRLDGRSRHARFGGGVGDAFIAAHARAAFAGGDVIYGFLAKGVLRGVAELRRSSVREAEAEAAFSVETRWQSNGVGTELLDRVLLAARNRGIKRLLFICLPENLRMQQLARKFSAELSHHQDGVVADVVTPHPNPVSMMREMIGDGTGLATAILDAQSRFLRTR